MRVLQRLVVVGAGGFGREVADVVDAINRDAAAWELVGVIDDAPTQQNLRRLATRGLRYLGTVVENIEDACASHYVVGIGSPQIRRALSQQLDAAGYQAATLIHPTATAGGQVSIGSGSVVCAGVRLSTNIALGRHVHLNSNCTVGHDSVVGDFVSVNPLASISGDCVIEDEVLIGVGGVILNTLHVGAGAVVGASACVVRSVPPGVIVRGVPAR